MAGDWIPACKGLTRKREVLVIAAATGRSRHEVAGILLEFWEWADGETADGAISGVTVDHLIQIVGADKPFWLAVVESGWLSATDGGIVLPHFDRWLGNSAKNRLDNTRRQQLSRKKRDTPARDAGDKSATREEKRREEKREEIPPRACDPTTPIPVPVPEQEWHTVATTCCADCIEDAAEEIAVLGPIPLSEFTGSAEDLAQRFADEYCGTYRAHKNPCTTRDGFAELLRLDISAKSILAAIHDKTRDRTEFFNDFKRRLVRPARASPQPTFDGLRRFLARGNGEGFRDTS